MRLHTIKSSVATTVVMGLWALLGVAVLLCAPVGCKKAADDRAAGASATASDSSSDSSGDANGTAANDDSGERGREIDPSMFPQIKDMMVQQASLPVVQADTIRQVLAENPDDQLRAILAELDAKNASIKAMLEKITSPADSTALQVDVPQAIGEAGELVAKANARIIEVLRAKTGGGG